MLISFFEVSEKSRIPFMVKTNLETYLLLKGSASNNDVMMTDLQKKLGLFLYGRD